MKVFKGMRKDMTCTMGKGVFRYTVGETYTEEQAKTREKGLHASEYVLEACSWYNPIDNRIFMCDASDVDEDGNDIISCKQLRVIKELDIVDICFEAVTYMIEHPTRNYERSGKGFCAANNKAYVSRGVAIARGTDPRVKGGAGAVIVLIKESDGKITKVSMALVGKRGIKTDTWYRIGSDGMEEA